MARKCGRCRNEGHTIRTCTEPSDVMHATEAPATSPDPFESPTQTESLIKGPWIPASHDSECDTCDGGIFAGDEIRADGQGGWECRTNCEHDETPHEDESVRTEPGSIPVSDHRKWCTRCKLLGHYAADCETPMLDGGQVIDPSVTIRPEPAPATHTGQPAQHTSPYIETLKAEVGDPGRLIIPEPGPCVSEYVSHSFIWNPVAGASQCAGCGEDNPVQSVRVSESGRCDGCSTVHAGECPTDPEPEHLYRDSTGVSWLHRGTHEECAAPECQPADGRQEPAPFAFRCEGCERSVNKGEPMVEADDDTGLCVKCWTRETTPFTVTDPFESPTVIDPSLPTQEAVMQVVGSLGPDPWEDPTEPKPAVNVSGQPDARYEWYGKQNRGYLVKLPETGDFRRYKNGKPKGLTRVTTFVKAASDSNALTDWAKRNVLIGASRRPDVVAKAHGLDHETGKGELMSLVGELETAAGAKVSADIGTLIHELTERWDGGDLESKDIPSAYRHLIFKYDETLKEHGLRPVPGLIERTTYIAEYGGVVGTLDRVYYHERSGQYLIGDVKTGKTLKYGMDEIESQEWAYAHGVNEHGVYDWNTDTWGSAINGCLCTDHLANEDCLGPKEITVSEEWGVVVHMPVQGDDAGKVMLVRADLQRGRRHADVCHTVREERSNKPKPEEWTGRELDAPKTAADDPWWEERFSCVGSKETAGELWQEAYDAGVPPERMERLKELADARLAELAPVVDEWSWRFRGVTEVSEAGELWEEARDAGVEPLELNRLVGLAQQRLRELGVSG